MIFFPFDHNPLKSLKKIFLMAKNPEGSLKKLETALDES